MKPPHSDVLIPYTALTGAEGDAQSIDFADTLAGDVLGALLMRVVWAKAADSAGADSVELVTTTLDVAGTPDADAPITFEAEIDRKTRTMVFAKGAARSGEDCVMTATAIYRIVAS
jgi:hypothetical protein